MRSREPQAQNAWRRRPTSDSPIGWSTSGSGGRVLGGLTRFGPVTQLNCKTPPSACCWAIVDDFQSEVDETWEKRLIPGVIPFGKQIEVDRPPAW